MKAPGWVCRGSPKLLSARAAALQHQSPRPQFYSMHEAACECLSIHPTADASNLSCLDTLSVYAHSRLPQQPLCLCGPEYTAELDWPRLTTMCLCTSETPAALSPHASKCRTREEPCLALVLTHGCPSGSLGPSDPAPGCAKPPCPAAHCCCAAPDCCCAPQGPLLQGRCLQHIIKAP